MNIDALSRFYQELTPENVTRFGEFYADDAWFKDPFNEVRGLPAIRRIFAHMFEQLDEPRFFVTERVVDSGGAMLVWELHYRMRLPGRREAQILRGVSHLKFDAAGKVCYHRDYWDTAEELYMKLPGLGAVMRGLRRMLAA
jgi:ketosteroid isomerase-like protein